MMSFQKRKGLEESESNTRHSEKIYGMGPPSAHAVHALGWQPPPLLRSLSMNFGPVTWKAAEDSGKV